YRATAATSRPARLPHAPACSIPLRREQLQGLLAPLPQLVTLTPFVHGRCRLLPSGLAAGGSAALRLSLPSTRRQLLVRHDRRVQRLLGSPLRLPQPHAAPTQRVKMVPLIDDGRLPLRLPLHAQQRHSLPQATAAIARHLFQVRELTKLLSPRLAADLFTQTTLRPAQAL